MGSSQQLLTAAAEKRLLLISENQRMEAPSLRPVIALRFGSLKLSRSTVAIPASKEDWMLRRFAQSFRLIAPYSARELVFANDAMSLGSSKLKTA
jgi:hypothetical protein